LFKIIKEYDRSIPIARLAVDHHQRHGRPLRIAVDEADWRFNNLTQAAVYAIKDTSDQAFQGQEKDMFRRIRRLLTLDIQLIFVFDGPGRPWKHGRRGQGNINYCENELLKEMLRCFGIPYHEAPGEAEAECARLQILGMVDGVWSQDSDCLMFGCTMWTQDDRVVKEKGTKDYSKENMSKSKKTVWVVHAAELKSRLQIDREGLVLFAILVGGDYNTKGLPSCGRSAAMKVLRKGLGKSLCICRNQRNCDIWGSHLVEALRQAGVCSIQVPVGFPDFKILQKYNSPKVSDDSALTNSVKLNLDHMRPIVELNLLEVTSSWFNMWGRLYMNWVGPVLLPRCISNKDSSLPREFIHDIRLTNRRAKKTDGENPPPMLERKLTFSPFGVTTLRSEHFEEERLGYWNGDRATLIDPEQRVECEIPEYWLSKVLPLGVLGPPPSQPIRKAAGRRDHLTASEPVEATGGPKRKRKTPYETPDEAASAKSPRIVTSTAAMSVPSAGLHKTPGQNRLKKASTIPIESIIEISDSEPELRLPPSCTRPASSIRSNVGSIIDFGSPSSSEDEISRFRDVGIRAHVLPDPPTRGRYHPRIETGVHSHPPLTALMSVDTAALEQPGLPIIPDTEGACEPSISSPLPHGDIRAARLRYFQAQGVSPSAAKLDSTPSNALGLPSRVGKVRYNIPQGVECVDFTDD
ncbi:PIN domain-like protein, partial [Setomelanomma holmii]